LYVKPQYCDRWIIAFALVLNQLLGIQSQFGTYLW